MNKYILIPLALLSCASVALTENNRYLLATVLFYNDGKGHQIVAAGHVSKDVNAAITQDIKHRISNTTIKVIPLLRQLKGCPAAEEIIGFVKEKFNHVYFTELPKWLASKVVYMKSKRMNSKNSKNIKLDDLDKDTKNNDEVVNTNLISEGNKDDNNKLSINDTAPVPNTYYMPNTVFYAVETKCKTPNDLSCYLNKGHKSHDKTSNKTFKRTKSSKDQKTNISLKKLFKKTNSQGSQV